MRRSVLELDIRLNAGRSLVEHRGRGTGQRRIVRMIQSVDTELYEAGGQQI